MRYSECNSIRLFWSFSKINVYLSPFCLSSHNLNLLRSESGNGFSISKASVRVCVVWSNSFFLVDHLVDYSTYFFILFSFYVSTHFLFIQIFNSIKKFFFIQISFFSPGSCSFRESYHTSSSLTFSSIVFSTLIFLVWSFPLLAVVWWCVSLVWKSSLLLILS